MVERDRFNNGTFAPKSSQVREVRSLRLTNRTWAALGSVAELKGITRADLIEELAANRTIEQSSSDRDEVEKLKEKVLELNAEKETYLNSFLLREMGWDLMKSKSLGIRFWIA